MDVDTIYLGREEVMNLLSDAFVVVTLDWCPLYGALPNSRQPNMRPMPKQASEDGSRRQWLIEGGSMQVDIGQEKREEKKEKASTHQHPDLGCRPSST